MDGFEEVTAPRLFDHLLAKNLLHRVDCQLVKLVREWDDSRASLMILANLPEETESVILVLGLKLSAQLSGV